MAKFKAKGVVIKAALTAAPTTVLAQMAEIAFDIGQRSLLDVTTHDSVTTKEYIDSGLRDTAELEVSSVYDPADAIHELIRAAAAAGTLVYMTLILPDTGNAQWAMSGFVTQFTVPNLGTNVDMKMNFKFKAAGPDTYTV